MSSSKRNQKSRVGFGLTPGLLFLSLLLIGGNAYAHNKVVVIPMAGDDVPGEITPFALIPADNPVTSDYTIGTEVTLDKVTSLEWQKVDNNMNYDFNSADNYCQNLTLDSKTDWRLPTIKELFSIVDFGTFDPAIDGMAFPGTDLLRYWSISDYRTAANLRFVVSFGQGGGIVGVSETTITDTRVRCVRSSIANVLVSVFTDNGDGSVTDLASGLNWQKQHDSDTKKHGEAESYCHNLILAGHSDWRLPETKELLSIVDFRLIDPSVNSYIFPSTNPGNFWSVSSDANNPDDAWYVNYFVGGVSTFVKENEIYVRCVRHQVQ